MWKNKIAMALFSVALVGCATVQEKEVPKDVLVPVLKACPEANVQAAGPKPELAIGQITSDTQIDRDVSLWKATVLQLQAYLAQVETERDDWQSAYSQCTKDN